MAKYQIIAWFVVSILVYGYAEILIGPQDIEATTEETVQLHCKATLGNVEWQHLAIGAPIPEHVYKDGFIYNGYKERFRANNTIDGTSVLTIRNVKPSDAGRFTCLENSETTSRKAAELIVYERIPSNRTCAGIYTCKPVCNDLELSCQMKARGNHIPSMQWIDSEGRQLDSMKVIVNEVTVSTVTLDTNPYVSARYTCQVKYPSTQLTSKYGWTYSTSVTKEFETLLKTEIQQKEAPPPQTTMVIVASIATVAGIACVVMASVMIYNRKCKNRTQKKSQVFSISERNEINAGSVVYQPLISLLTDGNANKETFVSSHRLAAGLQHNKERMRRWKTF